MESRVAPRYAGFWIRGLAAFIDDLILTLASSGIQVAFMVPMYALKMNNLRASGQSVPGFWDAFDPFWLQIVNAGIYVLMAFPYYVVGHYRYGTTLGKRPFRVYVVQAEGCGRVTMKQSLTRFFAYAVSYLPFGAGLLMAAFHPRKRALHDLIADTVSVYREGSLPPLGEVGSKT